MVYSIIVIPPFKIINLFVKFLRKRLKVYCCIFSIQHIGFIHEILYVQSENYTSCLKQISYIM